MILQPVLYGEVVSVSKLWSHDQPLSQLLHQCRDAVLKPQLRMSHAWPLSFQRHVLFSMKKYKANHMTHHSRALENSNRSLLMLLVAHDAHTRTDASQIDPNQDIAIRRNTRPNAIKLTSSAKGIQHRTLRLQHLSYNPLLETSRSLHNTWSPTLPPHRLQRLD